MANGQGGPVTCFPVCDKTDIAPRYARAGGAIMPPRSIADTRAALEAASLKSSRPLFATATVIAAYYPMKDEISPLPAMGEPPRAA